MLNKGMLLTIENFLLNKELLSKFQCEKLSPLMSFKGRSGRPLKIYLFHKFLTHMTTFQ